VVQSLSFNCSVDFNILLDYLGFRSVREVDEYERQRKGCLVSMATNLIQVLNIRFARCYHP